LISGKYSEVNNYNKIPFSENKPLEKSKTTKLKKLDNLTSAKGLIDRGLLLISSVNI
jgi:hypothetical protein